MVYALRDPSGFIKIGKTTNISRRFNQLQVGNPRRLSILREFHPKEGMTDLTLEKKLHDYFYEHRAVSLRDGYTEWYYDDILDEIINFDEGAAEYIKSITRSEFDRDYHDRICSMKPDYSEPYGVFTTLYGGVYKDKKTELIRRLRMYESLHITPAEMRAVIEHIPDKYLTQYAPRYVSIKKKELQITAINHIKPH